MPIREDVLRQQEELYGRPLAEVVAGVGEVLGLNQGQVAGVIGLSAPMLSQLVGGRRVKIGNPIVGARFAALAALADDVASGRRGGDEVAEALARLRTDDMKSSTTLGSAGSTGSPGYAHDQDGAVARRVQAMFRSVASAGEHLAAAEALVERHPAVAELLRVYGAGQVDEAEAHLRRHD